MRLSNIQRQTMGRLSGRGVSAPSGRGGTRGPRISLRTQSGKRSGISALNPDSELPLQLFMNGEYVYVDRVEFDYEGDATQLQLGVGVKRRSFFGVPWNSGQSLLQEPHQCWALSGALQVPVTTSLQHFTFTNLLMGMQTPDIWAANFDRAGNRITDIDPGDELDMWVWLFDANRRGWGYFGPEGDYLAFDQDDRVFRCSTAPL